ncbi:hypothetical protein [Streptomyces sp. NPDC051001]|uniref:hypothetical protein n=1 Tax=Streptomyces sp. NPDC051001 TaxID=3155795 RepID=UPI00343A879E
MPKDYKDGVVMDRCVNAHEVELNPLPPEEHDILAGCPVAAAKPLGEFGGTEVGVWTLTTGAVRDIEADEVFVVLAGDATVRFQTGRASTIWSTREHPSWWTTSPTVKPYGVSPPS